MRLHTRQGEEMRNVHDRGAGLRRDGIITFLQRHPEGTTGTALSEHFGVSRQIIVQDMAVLRAGGLPLLSSPRGYTLISVTAPVRKRVVVAVQHTNEQTEDELLVIVDTGCTVVDVAIDHPLYGEMRGTLMLSTRADVHAFMARVQQSGAGLLLNLTQGVHVHTLEADDEAAFAAARQVLAERGYLL